MRFLVLITVLTSCSSLQRKHELNVEFCALVENGTKINCPISETVITTNEGKRDFVVIRVSDVEKIAEAIHNKNNNDN